MQNEFQGTLFATQRKMLDAIAYEWMTAGGANDSATIDGFTDIGATALANDCIGAWDIDADWLTERDITADDIHAAFARFLADRPDRNA